MEEIIKAKNLRKVYKDGGESETIALDDVSFSVKKGEFVAIMGPSGSGKSTLLHILGFLDRPSSGQYWFLGKEMSELSDEQIAKIRNKKMGFVFQQFNLLPKVSVLENVKLPLLYSGIAESKWQKMAEEAIEKVGLNHRIKHKASELSGGEKQRVAIARALINDPEVIFADEPTGNLDSKSGRMIMEAIEELSDDSRTVVLITHETYTAEHAERIISLKDGMIDSDKKVARRLRTKDDGFNK